MTFDITKEEKRYQLNFFTNVILSEKASTGNIEHTQLITKKGWEAV
ncbi:TPA: hypothetical protein TZE08_001023 [Streptococcus suis]|nr:hypothetical protein [Streptococcus suis]